MAITDTDLSDYNNSPYHGGNFFITWREAGDTSLKAGALAEEADSAEEVKIATTTVTDSAYAFAVMACMADLDTDTAIQTAGDPVRLYLLGQGTILWLQHDGNADQTYKAGYWAQKSSNTAGAVELWSYTDGTHVSDNLAHVVGKSFYDETEGTSTGANANWNRFIT